MQKNFRLRRNVDLWRLEFSYAISKPSMLFCHNNGKNENIVFLQIDLEEAKGQEISKLQKALQDMQTQLDEAHDAIIHEKEAAKIAIEQAPPVIKEVPVIDNTKVEKLTEENNKLEVKSGNKILCIHSKW